MKISVMTKESYNTKSWGRDKKDVVEISNATREIEHSNVRQ